MGSIKAILFTACLTLTACGHSALSPAISPYLQETGPYQAPYNTGAYAAGNNSFYSNSNDAGFSSAGYDQTNADTSQANSYDSYSQSAPGTPTSDTQFAFDKDNSFNSPFADSPGDASATTNTPRPNATPLPDRAAAPIPSSQFDAVTDELKILTYNVWGLPGPLTKDRKARFERLGATLNAYDIVTLQETFSDDIEILKQSSGFAHHARMDNGGLLRLGSGLYTLSRFPIIKTDFMAFKKCTVADCLARKGVMMARIDHPTIGPIDVYTTHFQAENLPVAQQIRLEEGNRVLQELLHKNRSNYPVIITGDFNASADSPEYADLFARLPLYDIFHEVHPDQAGYTSAAGNPYKGADKKSARIDYIFALQKPGIKITPLEAAVTHQQPVDGFMLSDHYGVSATLRITQTGTSSAQAQ